MQKQFHTTEIFKPIVIILFLSLLFNLAVGQSQNTEFHKAPYLIFGPSTQSIKVLWQNNDSTLGDFALYFGDSLVKKITSQELTFEHQHAVLLDSLLPATYYRYQVEVNREVKEGSFTTAPSDTAQHFSFFAYGDTRTNPNYHDEVARQIMKQIDEKSSRQTFIISTGDVVANGNVESDWDEQLFDPQYENLQRMLASLPYMVSMGNHEGQGALFAKYFPYDLFQNPRYYYSFDYGNVHFVALDQLTDLSKNSVQYQWMVNDLATSNKAWKMVLLHKPGWSAGGHSNNTEVQKVLQPVFEKYGVKVVFAGHNHYYSRAEVDGIQHITTGGGGAPLYDPKMNREHILITDKSYHFCQVDVSANTITITVRRADGSLIEQFTIQP